MTGRPTLTAIRCRHSINTSQRSDWRTRRRLALLVLPPWHIPRRQAPPRPPEGRRPARLLDLGKDLLGGGDGVLDVLVRVRERHEARLKLRGGEVDALLEHAAVPLGKLLRVGSLGVGVAVDGSLAEEEAKHPADVASAQLVPSLLACLQDPVDQLLRRRLELLVLPGPLEDLERLDASSHREGVARQSPGLVHGPGGCDVLHDLLLAAIGADGEPPPDDLAHGGDVRGDAKVLLGAAVGDPEARHDLVEDEDGPVVVAELAEALEKLLGGDDEAGVSDDWLEDDGGDLALVLLEELLDRLEVIVLGRQRRLGSSLGNARRVGEAEGEDARAGRDEEPVGVTVVAPLELDDLVALGVGPDEAEHAHAGLCARVGEADHFDRGDSVNHHLGEHVLVEGGGAERGALLEGLDKRVVDLLQVVAADGGAPSADVVDVLVAVDVEAIGALHLVKDDGLAAHRLEGTHGGGHAAGHDRLGLRHDLLGLGGVKGVEGRHAGALAAETHAGRGHGGGEAEAGGLGGEDRDED
mmetsp:Transcript_7468/g.18103  ORF Transcript_7468/g.18103 Transcript_7468/m.18103 type:complete len:525 (+) Transcript_7468:23-1597(+)